MKFRVHVADKDTRPLLYDYNGWFGYCFRDRFYSLRFGPVSIRLTDDSVNKILEI